MRSRRFGWRMPASEKHFSTIPLRLVNDSARPWRFHPAATFASRRQLVLAGAGEAAQAQKIVDQLNTESPVDTLIQNYWLPTIRAVIALRKGDAKQAIALLEVDQALRTGNGQHQRNVADLRSRLGLSEGRTRLPKLTVQFQKMLAHRGLGQNAPIQALALLQLARAQAAAGDKPAARRSYQDFLSLWKQADPDLLLLKQAQSEYDNLKN